MGASAVSREFFSPHSIVTAIHVNAPQWTVGGAAAPLFCFTRVCTGLYRDPRGSGFGPVTGGFGSVTGGFGSVTGG
jgi:hypothetical protein